MQSPATPSEKAQLLFAQAPHARPCSFQQPSRTELPKNGRSAVPALVRNIVISGTNFWNPGDDFVRDGVIRILRELYPGEMLNFLFYNFNADFFPQSKFRGIADLALEGDLEKYRSKIDAIVIAGLPVGDEMKDLYYWVLANNLQDRVYLIGAGYESEYVAQFISQEPEATIFSHARVVTCRTAKVPEFLRSERIPYRHINCPAILSVPQVKSVPSGKKIERIGFSIQLPHGEGIPNHSCAPGLYELSVAVLRELSKTYAVEVVAHHKTEYFHFLNLFQNEEIPVLFSSFYRDLFEVYPRYDLVITTRLHASLFANGHGIPGIVINDTDRHTHTLEGFPHSVWVNNRRSFDRALARWLDADMAVIARESEQFKADLLADYLKVLRPLMSGRLPPAPGARTSREMDLALLARRIEFGHGVHLQEGRIRWLADRAELRLPTQSLSEPAVLSFGLKAGDLWCYRVKAFETLIRLNGKVVKRFVFNRDGQEVLVTLPLRVTEHSQLLTIESTASFVPAEIDANSRDARRLALKLIDLTFTAASRVAPEPIVPPTLPKSDSSSPAVVHKPEFVWNPQAHPGLSVPGR